MNTIRLEEYFSFIQDHVPIRLHAIALIDVVIWLLAKGLDQDISPIQNFEFCFGLQTRKLSMATMIKGN